MADSHPLLPDNLRLDADNERVWRGHQTIPLTPKAFALLRYLAERPGQLVTKDELLKAVWPEVIVSEGVLTTHMGVIRQALGDNAKTPRYIETVHRRGYRFIALLTPISPPSLESRVQSLGSEDQGPQHRPTGTLDARRQTLDILLVGREAELSQLQQRWERALSGERQLVLVTGEPGIGKTALGETFLERLETRDWRLAPSSQVSSLKSQAPSLWIGYGQCIEQHGAGEAYMPILEALGRLCRALEGERIIAILHQYAPTWLVQLPALLSAEQREALQRQTLGVTKTRMLREIAEALEALTVEQPLVLWLEDLHWSDASTLDLLAMLARRSEPARLLVLGSYRPVEVLGNGHPLLSLTQELQGHHLCTEVAPRLLTAADIDAYLQQRFPVSALPTDWARTLAYQSGGNPLFLINLIEDLVDRGVLLQVDDCWVLQSIGEPSAIEVPASLRHLIARQSLRLLPDEQQVLEAASIAGIEFSAAAVAAALETELVEVEKQCAGLANRQQFLRAAGISEWPDGTVAARYGFQHALYQQLWHERVTPARQVQWHLRIGERKEAGYGARAGEIAAELAVHFEQGREYRRAIHYLQQAGERAAQRSAYIEALHHFSRGLELLKTLPETAERNQQELTLHTIRGPALMATRGYATSEVATTYARARELSRHVEDVSHLAPVFYGLWIFYLVRGEVRTAQEMAQQLMRLAQSVQDPALRLEAHFALGQILYFMGDFSSAHEHLQQSLALYTPHQSSPYIRNIVQDPGVMSLCYISWNLWVLGHPDQACKRSNEALTLAQAISHPFSKAFALNTAANLYVYRREWQTAQQWAEALSAFAQEQGFALFVMTGAIFQGQVRLEQGTGEEGIANLQHAMDVYKAGGVELGRPRFLAALADAYRKTGRPEQGLSLLNEALAKVNETDERRDEAELYRLKGELLLAQAEKLRD